MEPRTLISEHIKNNRELLDLQLRENFSTLVENLNARFPELNGIDFSMTEVVASILGNYLNWNLEEFGIRDVEGFRQGSIFRSLSELADLGESEIDKEIGRFIGEYLVINSDLIPEPHYTLESNSPAISFQDGHRIPLSNQPYSVLERNPPLRVIKNFHLIPEGSTWVISTDDPFLEGVFDQARKSLGMDKKKLTIYESEPDYFVSDLEQMAKGTIDTIVLNVRGDEEYQSADEVDQMVNIAQTQLAEGGTLIVRISGSRLAKETIVENTIWGQKYRSIIRDQNLNDVYTVII